LFSLVKNEFAGIVNSSPSGNHEFKVSDLDKNIAFIGENVLYVSKNFQTGADFYQVSSYQLTSTTHADIRSIVEVHTNGQNSNSNHYLFIGHDGGISKNFLGTGSGWENNISETNWQNINNDLQISQAFGFDIMPTTGYPIVGLQDNGTQKYNGTLWQRKCGGDGAAVKVSRYNPSVVYAQANNSFLRSDNSGDDFGNGWNFNQQISQNMAMELDPVDDRLLWGAVNKLHRFNHVNTTVEHFPASGTYLTNGSNNDIRAFDISKSNPDIIFVGVVDPVWGDEKPYTKRLFKSVNAGSSFTDITEYAYINSEKVFNWLAPTSIVIDPYNKDILYIALNNYNWDPSDETKGKFRVIKSINGGDTWTDMSTGLPPFPVTCLVYQEGTDEVLYAGTDLGIYRWNKQLQTWECYNKGLHNAIITNLEIDYCRNKILCSTWGRGVWSADLRPVTQIFEITESQTWEATSFHNFNTSVSVKSGVTLTIKGKVTFAKDNWLQIEPGAKVIVDGGKLFNYCDKNWEGIHVAGDPGKDQYTVSNQGYLFLKDAEIQNADVAVSTAALDNNGNIDWSKTGGGIVIAVNTTFKNNKRHAEFMEYKKSNNYAGSFTNCTFELNQTCNASNQSLMKNMTMVIAWGVQGIKFTGCEFKNPNGADNADQPNYNRGTGIFTLDATMQVSGNLNLTSCNIQKRGLFSNLSTGINSTHSPGFTVSGKTKVKDQNFELNDKGIVITNGVTYNVYRNNFNLFVPGYISPSNIGYFNRIASPGDYELGATGIAGIYTNNSSGFLIEQNNFEFSDQISSYRYEIIIPTVFNNSLGNGGGGNFRLNHIQGSPIGAQTQQNNQALQLTCNGFENTYNAIKMNPVTTTQQTPGFGICDPRATDEGQKNRTDYYNTFISNSPYDATHYPNNIKTYVIEPGANDRPDPNKVIRVDVNDCSNIVNGSVIPKDFCLPNKSLNEICHSEWEELNPDKGAFNLFKTRRNGISDSMDNELYNPQEISQAQSDLKYYTIEATQAKNRVIWAYNILSELDSTVNYTDSIIAFLANETDVASRKQLIATYYAVGDYTKSSQNLETLPQTTDELVQFKAYYNLMIAVASDERNIYQLNSEETGALQNIAATNTTAALAARGILTLVNGEVYSETIERTEEEQMLTSTRLKNELNSPQKLIEKNIKVYPNPANQNVMISYELELDSMKGEAYISLIDIAGKEILLTKIVNTNGVTVLSTASFNNSLYFIKLYTGSLLIASRKIIINH